MLEKLKISDDCILQTRQVGEELKHYLFNIVSGDCFELNEVSWFILDSILKGNDMRSIEDFILAEFGGCNIAQVRVDVHDFIDQCILSGILIKA